MFSIKAITNQSFANGKLTDVVKYLVIDAEGKPVATKFFDSEEAAQAHIDGLGNLAEGLAFAKAQFPGLADKALMGKANVVAGYLDWIAAGRPVKELEAEAPEAEGTTEAEEAAPAALPEGEDF